MQSEAQKLIRTALPRRSASASRPPPSTRASANCGACLPTLGGWAWCVTRQTSSASSPATAQMAIACPVRLSAYIALHILSVELAQDGLDVVPVRIEQEGGVVAAAGLGAVLLAHPGPAVVAVAGLDPGAVEDIHLVPRARDERDMRRPARLLPLAGPDDEVRVLRAALVLPERRDPERREDGSVEGLARLGVADGQRHVVEDDPAPVPLHGPSI